MNFGVEGESDAYSAVSCAAYLFSPRHSGTESEKGGHNSWRAEDSTDFSEIWNRGFCVAKSNSGEILSQWPSLHHWRMHHWRMHHWRSMFFVCFLQYFMKFGMLGHH